MHFVNLQGYGENSTPVQGDTRSNQVAGFSEKVVDMLVRYEENLTSVSRPKISTSSRDTNFDEIREKFALMPGSHRKTLQPRSGPNKSPIDPSLL